MNQNFRSLWNRLNLLSVRCSSSEVPKFLSRNHTNEKSFKSVNQPFLSHPVSCGAKLRPILTDEKTLALFKELEKELQLGRQNKASLHTDVPYEYSYMDQDQIVFMSEKELKAAQDNSVQRQTRLMDNPRQICMNREVISPDNSCDEGLEWLHDSDIIFADCSYHATSQERYIVTRKVDGSLYHNSHEERDHINSSFFREESQIYPPLDMFEDDVLFKKMLASSETDFLLILDYLISCYPADHPKYNLRHTQIMQSLFNKPDKMDSIVYTRHFLPLLTRAIHENAIEPIKRVSNMLYSTGRVTLSVIIEHILMQSSALTQKEGQSRVDKTIIIQNSIHSISLPNVPVNKKNIITVASICGIDVESVQKVQSRGGDLIATLKSEELASQLHNDGSGRVLFYEDRLFHVYPKLVTVE